MIHRDWKGSVGRSGRSGRSVKDPKVRMTSKDFESHFGSLCSVALTWSPSGRSPAGQRWSRPGHQDSYHKPPSATPHVFRTVWKRNNLHCLRRFLEMWVTYEWCIGIDTIATVSIHCMRKCMTIVIPLWYLYLESNQKVCFETLFLNSASGRCCETSSRNRFRTSGPWEECEECITWKARSEWRLEVNVPAVPVVAFQ